MSWGSLSQFSPNLQQPMPTIATLSRMASLFMRSIINATGRPDATGTSGIRAVAARRGHAINGPATQDDGLAERRIGVPPACIAAGAAGGARRDPARAGQRRAGRLPARRLLPPLRGAGARPIDLPPPPGDRPFHAASASRVPLAL